MSAAQSTLTFLNPGDSGGSLIIFVVVWFVLFSISKKAIKQVVRRSGGIRGQIVHERHADIDDAYMAHYRATAVPNAGNATPEREPIPETVWIEEGYGPGTWLYFPVAKQ